MSTPARALTPATWFLVVAILFFATAAVLWTMISGVVAVRGGYATLTVPARADLQFNARTTYTVFLEFPRTVDSQSEHKPRGVALLECRLRDARSGLEIPLRPVAEPRRYGYRKTIGESLYEFDIDRAGRYTFEADHPLSETSEPITLAIRQRYAHQTGPALLRAAAIFAAAGLLVAGILWRALRAPAQDAAPAAPL